MHLCLVGCGKMAQTHAKILQNLQHFLPQETVSLSFASRSLTKAQAYQQTFQGRMAFGSYADAVCHPDIDVVVICTPNDSHVTWALQGLEQHKHLIIEKPFALTSAEADAILKQATDVDRHVLVAENHRFRPHIRYVERVIHSGALGVLKMIKLNVMRSHHFRAQEWRANRQHMGGGPLIDGGIHWVNVLLTLGGGSATDICALEPPTTATNCPREDSIAVMCRLHNGAIGHLIYSWGISGALPLGCIAVHGAKGSVYVSNVGRIGLKWLHGPKPLLLPCRDWRGWRAMWQDFLLTLAGRQGHQSLAHGGIGRRDLAFVEAAYGQRAHEAVVSSPGP